MHRIALHVAADARAGGDNERLRNMLSGVLAKNPGELESFHRRYDEVFLPAGERQRLEVERNPERQRPTGTPRPSQASKAGRRTRWMPAVALGVAIALAAVCAYLFRPALPPPEQVAPAPASSSGGEREPAPVGRSGGPAVTWGIGGMARPGSAQAQDFAMAVPGWYAVLEPAAVSAPLAAAFGWLAALWWRRFSWRAPHRFEHEDRIEALKAAAEDVELFSGPDVRGAARRLRGGGADDPLGVIDIRRTVEATAANAGLFTPVRQGAHPRCLNTVLIERASANDHLDHLFSHAARRIASDGVPLRLFKFSDDPRVVTGAGGSTLRLDELTTDARQERLVIIGTDNKLFQPLADEMVPGLADGVERWQRRYFLSTKPLRQWGAREMRLLDAGFSVGTATPRGLAALARAAETRAEPPVLLDVRRGEHGRRGS